MPNNCNSITKFILVYCVVFLTSCSSISLSTSSESRYTGKLSFSQNNEVSNYTVNILVFYEDIIIQLSKPFLGNLIKIKFNPNEGLSSHSEINDLDFSLFKNLNKKQYLNFFNSCFDVLSYSKDPFIIDKYDLELRCEYKKIDIFSFSLKLRNEIHINGTIKSE